MNAITDPINVEDMLASSSSEIESMKTASGFSRPNFDNLCMPLIRKFGEAVQRLPLSDSGFKELDGAWNYGLTAATVALQYANTLMFFPDAIAEERRLLEPQCHFAAFACTLASAVAIVAQNVQLLNDSVDDEYHPLVCPISLQAWLQSNTSARFKWRRPVATLSGMESAAIAARFFPAGLLQPFDLKISLMIFGAINPSISPSGIETTLARVVRLPSQKVLEHYLRHAAQDYQTPTDSKKFDTSSAATIGSKLIDSLQKHKAEGAAIAESIGQDARVASPIPDKTAVTSPEISLENVRPELREWFTAMITHEKYSILKNQYKLTQAGIEIPATLLGMFGITATTVRSWLDEAGLLEGRTENGRGFVLKSGLATILQIGK